VLLASLLREGALTTMHRQPFCTLSQNLLSMTQNRFCYDHSKVWNPNIMETDISPAITIGIILVLL
jgi:hypothetical protein